MRGVLTIDVDMCMFGLSVVDVELCKKPTRIITHSAEAVRALTGRRCDCGHSHVHLEGRGPGGNKTALAQQYPEAFCRAVLLGIT